MHLIKSIIKKSQMSFDFGKHEEERTVHATTRHMQSGAVAQVKEHQRRTMVADKPVHEMTRDEFDKWVGRRSPTDIIGKMMQEKHAGKTAQEIAAHYTQKYKLSKPINLVEFKTLQAWHDYLKKIGAKRDPLNGHGGGYHAPTDNYHNIVMVRDDQTDENYLGILRHEIEHAIDRDKGYEPAIYNTHQENIENGTFQKLGNDTIVSRAKRGANQSIGDILRDPYKGHHQHYDYFELDYPRRSMVRQAIKQGKAVPESIRSEFADRHSAAQQKREQAATAKNAEVFAVRQERAREDFAEALQNMAGITKEQADRVTQYYLDKRLATVDSVNGTIRAKHGAYLDKEVILTAVKETSFQAPIMEVPKRKQRTNPEPKPTPEHRIVKVDDPDGGHGHFIIYDKDMKTVEIPNEHGEIEAAWPRLLDAGRALDRHKGVTHKQVKVARGEYDMHKSIAHPVSLIKSRKLHGRMDYQGIPISIETGRSRIREWHNPHDNTSGMMLFKDHYGYITNGPDGTDGDKLDVFVGQNMQAPNVYIVNQMKAPDYTEFDEQKVMLGYDSEEAAKAAYLSHYDNKRFFDSIVTVPFADFKAKVESGEYHGKAITKSTDEKSGLGRFLTESELREYAMLGILKVNPKDIDMDEFRQGMKDEQEHKDVTGGDMLATAKIVLAHLKEDPKYYSKLKAAGL